MKTPIALRYLEDLWDDAVARTLEAPELLRYRSNLLGRDLRITNFGGGNTSSKVAQPDPLDGRELTTLWVKGSGGDLGSIKREGFATLDLAKLRGLERRYRGVEHEDEMVGLYPLCALGASSVAASIDTPLHGFLPFAHVDHLHPDWGIALAAAANGRERMAEFNRRFEHHLLWIPWQRPGFELGLMLRSAVESQPGCDGVVLGGHGLFTWGETSRQCYLNSITIIDQLGQFVVEHIARADANLFGGELRRARADRREVAIDIFPFLRGRVSGERRVIGSFSDATEVLRFINSHHAAALAHLGTSCPDHFVRTKIRPLYVNWTPQIDGAGLCDAVEAALETYREEYRQYYDAFAVPDSPAMRDVNPTVVLIPGIGMFSFGKSKTEARITGEFYVNAIHVMEGASLLSEGEVTGTLPQCGPANDPASFKVFTNYVALPALEAFRIEYWAMEEAKIRRQPPEKELSRRVALVVGGASGIGREVARLAAIRGAHVFVADRNEAGAAEVANELGAYASKEFTGS